MFKIITIVGARPQFVKAAMLSRRLRKEKKIKEILIHTGQHYDLNLSGIFFEQLEMTAPDLNLNIGSESHGYQTGEMLRKIEKSLIQLKPDLVIVYGDTNSTLAGALSAAKLNIPVAHIEAGLRSYNKNMPEEINRVLTDHCSDLLFPPTQKAVENLIRENIRKDIICNCGDIMYENFLYFSKKLNGSDFLLKKLNISENNYLVVTIHRAENTDSLSRINNIFGLLKKLSGKIKIIFPMHPRTKKFLKHSSGKIFDDNIIILDPVGYFDMLNLQKNSKYIITDSGGIQKEAYFMKKPCLILRNETEWTELIDKKYNFLASPDSKKIMYEAAIYLLECKIKITDDNLYGIGNTSEIIINKIKKTFIN